MPPDFRKTFCYIIKSIAGEVYIVLPYVCKNGANGSTVVWGICVSLCLCVSLRVFVFIVSLHYILLSCFLLK